MHNEKICIGDIIVCSFDKYLISKSKDKFSLISLTTKREFPITNINKKSIEIETLDRILEIKNSEKVFC